MSSMVDRAGLAVADVLATFIETQALPGLTLAAGDFWRGMSELMVRFSPENRRLLAIRDELQARIDGWHEQRRGQPFDGAAYRAFLGSIGYLVPEPARFESTRKTWTTRSSVPGRNSSCRYSMRVSR